MYSVGGRWAADYARNCWQTGCGVVKLLDDEWVIDSMGMDLPNPDACIGNILPRELIITNIGNIEFVQSAWWQPIGERIVIKHHKYEELNQYGTIIRLVECGAALEVELNYGPKVVVHEFYWDTGNSGWVVD